MGWFVQVCNSILQGDGQANHMARLIVYDLMEFLTCGLPRVRLAQYVDDVVSAEAGAPIIIVPDLALFATELCQGLSRLRLRVSPKSTIVASLSKLAMELRDAIFQSTGLLMKIDSHCRDLGLDATAGHRRLKVAKQRLAKARQRAKRIQRLARVHAPAGPRLCTAAYRPQSTFHVPVHGAAPSLVRRLRAQTAACTCLAAPNRCTASVLALSYGPSSDPGVSLPCQLVREWVHCWVRTADQARSTRAWTITRDKLKAMAANRRWQIVRGPMSSVIATLLALEWDPILPGFWSDASGGEWALTPQCLDCSQLVERIALDPRRQIWAKASQHHCGAGLALGVDFRSAILHLKALSSRGQAQDHAILAVTICAGIWTEQRRCDSGMTDSPTCPRCGAAPESDAHRYWYCPANRALQDPAVLRSAYLERWAREEIEAGQEAFWLRGLVPRDWTHPPPPEQSSLYGLGEALIYPIPLEINRVYIDGSGDSADPRFKKSWLGSLLDH